MAYSPIAFTAANYRDYKFNWIKAYEPGTTTPKVMATDSSLGTLIAKAEVNVDGFIVSSGGALIIPFIEGSYDLYMFKKESEADDNDTSSAVRLADNIKGAADLISRDTTISETPPLIKSDGDRWIRCSDMKGFVWYIDEDGGQWVQERPSYGIDTVQNTTIPYVFNTVEAMTSSLISFPNGKVLQTKSYRGATVGDVSGAGLYKVMTLADFGGVPDGFGDHAIAGDFVAKLINDGEINILQYGADNAGTTDPQDASLVFQAAIDKGLPIYVPKGQYRILSKLSITSEGTILRGDGPATQFDCIMTDALFQFPTLSGRSVKEFKNFSVISTAGTMSASGVVFLFDGTGTGGALSYTSGYKFTNIEVGGGGEFGCVWDVTDTFRLTIKDCGYTSVSNPVRIRGSVVQCTIDNLTGNNTDYIRNYKAQNCGVFMEARSDYLDAAQRVPENVKVTNSGFVKHRRGMQSVGLAITSENNDFDFIRDFAWVYGGGNGHNITGGYIAPSGSESNFIGVLVDKAQNLDSVNVRDIIFNTYEVVGASQIGIQVGSGGVSPFNEVAGVNIIGNRFYGRALSWNRAIECDRSRIITVSENAVTGGIIKAGGFAINATNSKNLTCNSNACNAQTINITAPLANSVGTVNNNDANIITAFIAGTFDISRNRNEAS
tara:strand:- start:232 stop:2220 length:1989 start_codon:yes stop_codon:yes gene_type:complete